MPQEPRLTDDKDVLGNLEEAVAPGSCVDRFVFTSTTSVFGRALTPLPEGPAAWITEDIVPLPRNIYGVTKAAAEDLCEIIGRDQTMERFCRWFGGPDELELLDTTIGEVGPKLYVRWRVRLKLPEQPSRLVEQHVFATPGDRIGALDLLCSGFVTQ